MRHGKKINHLSRKSAHRKALLANLASSLIMHKRIRTTTAKAKALRSFIEPVITRSKEDSTHSRRLAFSYLGNKHAVSELFREVSTKIGDRPGGYTRIMKVDTRAGDNADMCIIELVDYNENLLGEKEAAKAKTGRKRRARKKPVEATAAGETASETGETETGLEKTEETDESESAEDELKEAGPEAVKSKAERGKTADRAVEETVKKSKPVKAKSHKPEAEKKEGENSKEVEETKEDSDN
jgi:large subunit ribosomal protein L17